MRDNYGRGGPFGLPRPGLREGCDVEREWISVDEFVRRAQSMGLPLKQPSVLRLIRKGVIPHTRLGRLVLIDWKSFLALLERNARGTPEGKAKADGGAGA